MTKFIFLCIAMVLCCANTSLAADQSKPNIVFIYADDWGWGDLSSHGNTWLKTPHIDSLAAQGMDFHQFNVASSICSPSRISAMTGNFPARYGINTVFGLIEQAMPDWLDPEAPFLPRILQEAGYKTAHFGKWHMQLKAKDAPSLRDYGIDESFVFNGPGPRIPFDMIGKHAADYILANKGEPFYLNVWFHETHSDFFPKPETMQKWQHLNEQQQVYASAVTEADNDIGMILAALEKKGVADNTIVIFSSDNGPAKTATTNTKRRTGRYGTYYSVGETGGLRGGKSKLFEGGVRTPLIIRWPGQTPNGKINKDTVISTVDLLPTLLAAAGVALPMGVNFDGENMLAAIKGEPLSRSRPLYWKKQIFGHELDSEPFYAVRDEQWKFFLNKNLQPIGLYNIPIDRAESNDVAKDYPDIAQRLNKMLMLWIASMPTKPDPRFVSKFPTNKRNLHGN